MNILYKTFAKPILFTMNPERAHHLTMNGLKRASSSSMALKTMRACFDVPDAPELSVDLWGLHFRHPIGLAAGLDKNAEAVPAFSSCGFSFMEVGTVTPKPQPGNDQPRLFRLPEDQALINRMGFNNAGVDAMAHHLELARPYRVPVAVNIGKNKVTPNDEAAEDYRACIRRLYTFGDFFVINISSPNTPDLRKLQHGEDLVNLLTAVKEEIQIQAGQGAPKPVLVKIAPDMSETELNELLDRILQVGVSGIIATNTTLDRQGLSGIHAKEAGGLSGIPLQRRSTDVIRFIFRKTNGNIPVIGVGGIFNANDAYEKIRAGASLVEIYTSLIYRGPEVVKQIHHGLSEKLKTDGFNHISEAVGIDAALTSQLEG